MHFKVITVSVGWKKQTQPSKHSCVVAFFDITLNARHAFGAFEQKVRASSHHCYFLFVFNREETRMFYKK
ncbi:MAG: hypothetical protein ACI90V_000372 [Bacillariaceae sp.]|jgi:hypothetical protein